MSRSASAPPPTAALIHRRGPHLPFYAFGCTGPRPARRETLRKLVFGLKQIGNPDDRAFDRTTGEGFVDACDGQYADALAKGHGVNLLHAETTGALAGSAPSSWPRSELAKQSHLPGATDLTQYGEGGTSPKAFLNHHVANISTAIQAADAGMRHRARRRQHARPASIECPSPPSDPPLCMGRQSVVALCRDRGF